MEIKPQIIVGPKSGLNSSNLDPSAIRPIISLISKGVFKLGSITPNKSSWLYLGGLISNLGLFPSLSQFK